MLDHHSMACHLLNLATVPHILDMVLTSLATMVLLNHIVLHNQYIMELLIQVITHNLIIFIFVIQNNFHTYWAFIIGKNASLANFTKLIRLMNLTAYDFFILPVGIYCVVIGVLILIFTASFSLAAPKKFFEIWGLHGIQIIDRSQSLSIRYRLSIRQYDLYKRHLWLSYHIDHSFEVIQVILAFSVRSGKGITYT